MKKKAVEGRFCIRHAATVATALLLLAGRADAHHSRVAQYDESKTVTLKGAVTAVEWNNPHVIFHIDVPGPTATLTNWAIEFTGPNMLYRAGWRKETLRPGDAVTFQAFPARDGSHAAYMRAITFADGRVFNGMADGLPHLEPPRASGSNR